MAFEEKSRQGFDIGRKTYSVRIRRPVRDGIFYRYFVPDGTSGLVDDQAFYQYFVPNGTLQTITS